MKDLDELVFELALEKAASGELKLERRLRELLPAKLGRADFAQSPVEGYRQAFVRVWALVVLGGDARHARSLNAIMDRRPHDFELHGKEDLERWLPLFKELRALVGEPTLVEIEAE